MTEINNTDEEISEDTIDMVVDTLTGDMRDTVLGIVKAQPAGWGLMSSNQQRDYARSIERVCDDIVRRAVKLIASEGRRCIVATLEQYVEKDGIKATLKLHANSHTVQSLHEAVGGEVLLVAASAEGFRGERAPVEIEADQRPLFDQTDMGDAA